MTIHARRGDIHAAESFYRGGRPSGKEHGMKLKRIAMTLCAAALWAQSGAELFQQALRKQRSEGDLAGAIRIYERILQERGTDRKLASRALLQIAQCQERQGGAHARRGYERVLKEYADQPEAANEARARLAALGAPAAVSKAPRVRQLWAGPDADPEGSVSPDGRWLTFPNWDTGDLGIRDLHSGAIKLLTNTGGWEKSGGQFNQDSSFSPDGKLIAYNWFVKNGYEIRIMNADGTGVRTAAFKDVPGYAVPRGWSADGRTLAIVQHDQQGLYSLHLLNVASGEPRRVIAPRPVALWGVSISPDGQWLAYDSGEWEMASDIFVLPLGGGEPRPLVAHHASDMLPIWAADGRSLLFVSDRAGSHGLYQLPVENGRAAGNARQIKGDLGSSIFPIGFTRAGAFHYGLQTRGLDIYEAPYDPATGQVGKPVLISESRPGRNSAPAYSPDGKSLAWIASTVLGQASLVAVRDLLTGHERTYQAQTRLISASWSHDGSRLIFDARSQEPNTTELLTLDLSTGRFTLLHKLTPSRNRPSPVLSADGRKVYAIFREWPKEEWQVISLDSETRRTEALCRIKVDATAAAISSLALSPDGRQLAFIVRGAASGRRSRLMTLPVTGGQPRLIVEYETQNDGMIRSLTYAPDGLHALIRQGREKSETGVKNPTGLLRVNLQTGEAKPLDFEGVWVQSPTVHPSGRKIAFQAGGNEMEIWVAENFLPPAQTVSARRP
jgi:Tol biopolymer transport system component